MSDVLKFPGSPVTAEQFVALILRESPALAVHRQRLITELEPIFNQTSPVTAEISIPDGLARIARELLTRQIHLYAQRCAIAFVQPALVALVDHIVREGSREERVKLTRDP